MTKLEMAAIASLGLPAAVTSAHLRVSDLRDDEFVVPKLASGC